MTDVAAYRARATRRSVETVPKQSRPSKVGKSVRVRPWLLERVEKVCEQQQLTFNDAVERALEAWVDEQEKD